MLQSASRPDVSVVVVNYNAGTLLADCVAAVLPQSREVLVVDNGSHDGSIEHLAARFADEPALRVLLSGRNLGFAAACNLGIAAAQCGNLLFLNPDCCLQPDAVPHLQATLERHPRAALVGGLLLNPDGSEQRGCRRRFPGLGSAFVRLFGLTALSRRWPRLLAPVDLHGEPLPGGAEPVDAVSGACMLVRGAALREVGGWDEGYFLHCEDLDWCMRFHRAGWQVLFDPAARGIHHQGTCSRAVPLFVEWHKHKGMLRYFRKFNSGLVASLLLLPVAAGVWAHFSLLALRQLGRRLCGRSV